ncbi:MAG: hypothetical protein AABW56_01805 [Nanoarchaeota archaeon]
MREEDLMSEEFEHEEDIYSEEELDEMEPEMQGFITGWKRAGRYEKKEKHINEISEDFEEKY